MAEVRRKWQALSDEEKSVFGDKIEEEVHAVNESNIEKENLHYTNCVVLSEPVAKPKRVELPLQDISNQVDQPLEKFHHPQQIEVFTENNKILNLAHEDATGWLKKSKFFVLTREQDLAAFKAQTEARRQELEAKRLEAEARRQEMMAEAEAKRIELMTKFMCKDN